MFLKWSDRINLLIQNNGDRRLEFLQKGLSGNLDPIVAFTTVGNQTTARLYQ